MIDIANNTIVSDVKGRSVSAHGSLTCFEDFSEALVALHAAHCERYALGGKLTGNYEEYERACQKIRKENKAILYEFETWIRAKGVSNATVEKHRYNIDFYVNEFLLYEEAMSAEGL